MSHAKRYADKGVANIGRGPKTGNPRSDMPYSDAVPKSKFTMVLVFILPLLLRLMS